MQFHIDLFLIFLIACTFTLDTQVPHCILFVNKSARPNFLTNGPLHLQAWKTKPEN